MKTSTVVATCWSFDSLIGTGWPSATTVTRSGAMMRERCVNSPSPMHQRFIRQMRGHTGWFDGCAKPSKIPMSINLPLRSWRTSSHNTLACKSGNMISPFSLSFTVFQKTLSQHRALRTKREQSQRCQSLPRPCKTPGIAL